MRRDLLIELRRQHNHVLAVAREIGLLEVAAVPDAAMATSLGYGPQAVAER